MQKQLFLTSTLHGFWGLGLEVAAAVFFCLPRTHILRRESCRDVGDFEGHDGFVLPKDHRHTA